MPEVEISHRREGTGPPLLLIHGIGSELCVWEPLFDELAAEHDVIAVDLPGFGNSPALPEGTTPTPGALAAAVRAFCENEGIAVPHVAGNSLGGWVALEMGKEGAARTVTCLSPAGLWGRPLTRATVPTTNPARRAARLVRPLLPLLLLSKRVRRLALMNFVAHPDRVPRSATRRMISSYARADAYEATSLAMRGSFFSGAQSIDVPVSVGWGERDRLLRPAPVHAPQARSEILPGCGHIPMWDDPQLVSHFLLEGALRGRDLSPKGPSASRGSPPAP